MPDLDNAALTEVPTPSADDALMFELNGYTLGWRPSGLALKRAADRGLEIGEILVDLQKLFTSDVDPEDLKEMSEEELEEANLGATGGFSDLTDIVAELVWLGTLHFEPEVRQDAILALIDPESMEDLPVDRMMQRLFPAIKDELEEEGEGK